MIGDPRDAWTYRIAVGVLGLALLCAIAGAVVLAAVDGPDPNVAMFSSSHTTAKTNASAKTRALENKTASSTRTALTIPVVSDDASVSVSPTISLETAKPATDGPAVPVALYVLAAALIGALLGVLAPTPLAVTLPRSSTSQRSGVGLWRLAVGLFALLVAIGVVVLAYAVLSRWVADEYAAIVAAAVLLGLLVPSPARRW